MNVSCMNYDAYRISKYKLLNDVCARDRRYCACEVRGLCPHPKRVV